MLKEGVSSGSGEEEEFFLGFFSIISIKREKKRGHDLFRAAITCNTK